MSTKDYLDPQTLRDINLQHPPQNEDETLDDDYPNAYAKRTKREWIELMDRIRRENGDWSPSDAD